MPKLRTRPSIQAYISVIIFEVAAAGYLASQQYDYALTLAFVLLAIFIGLFFLFIEPIPQPQAYHNFADRRIFVCSCHGYSDGFFLPPSERRKGIFIPNFGDVVSNLFIFAGGLFGVMQLQLVRNAGQVNLARQWQLELCLPILFHATILVSIGSTYYHWNPTDRSLLWDRLPMTIAFVSIFCFMLEEYTTFGLGKSFLIPLMYIGVVSIVYWRLTNDLRLYALAQFLPLLLIAILLICKSPMHGGKMQHQSALLLYVSAKYSEDTDYEIFELTRQIISGHSLKHVLAGLASIAIASTVH